MVVESSIITDIVISAAAALTVAYVTARVKLAEMRKDINFFNAQLANIAHIAKDVPEMREEHNLLNSRVGNMAELAKEVRKDQKEEIRELKSDLRQIMNTLTAIQQNQATIAAHMKDKFDS